MQVIDRFRAWYTRQRHSPAVKKAMEQYREANPICEWCGGWPVHVHHIEPVQVAPDQAGDVNNMISLCADRCHLVLGHANNWGRRYVPNVRQIAMLRQLKRVPANARLCAGADEKRDEMEGGSSCG